MKRSALFLIAVAAVLSLPATAAAFRGVAVARDSARQSVIIASQGGLVRTVRAPGHAGAVRLGRRLVVSARRLRDGTYRAGTLRAAGHARRALVRGVVVRNQRKLHRLILSAGGSVFAVRTGRGFASAGRGPEPGDRVEVRVVITANGLRAAALEDLGHDGTLELEGIFLGLTGDGSLRIAVVHRGEVFVAVPAGLRLPLLKAGDETELHVTVDAAGAFTLVRIENEDDNEDRGEVEVKGKIAALSMDSITVDPRRSSPVTCRVPKGVELTSFKVGELVEMRCVRVKGALTLTRLKSEDDDHDGGGQGGGGHGGGGDDDGHGGHGG
jgi:hypothetical protein